MPEGMLPDAITDSGSYAGKTHSERITGRFYTPDALASDLAGCLITTLAVFQPQPANTLTVCDPFCGDGRLAVALLIEIAKSPLIRARKLFVTLRDIDRNAVKTATRDVNFIANELGLDVLVREEVGDSFANAAPQRHDVVITNPPWELLKPDPRETANLDAASTITYRRWLRARCDLLDERFPDSKADVAWAGWGTNLARCGWDLALRSCAAGGVLGIVLPSTILADQASVSMRRSALRRARLIDIAAYPPEARLFAKVDQPVVTATFVAQTGDYLDASLRLFGPDRLLRAERQLRMSAAELEATDYALPVGFGAESSELLGLFAGLPKFGDLESNDPTGLWTGRELDGTNLQAKLCATGQSPFISGKMVQRHAVVQQPSQFVPAALAGRFHSAKFERLVWRDVSRSSQHRRMIGTIIPAGWVTSNSLHVAHFRNKDRERLCALYAVISSFVFEFQVRSRLATGHMSLGIVRGARIPEMEKRVVTTLSRAVERALAIPTADGYASLEVKAARAFGIGRDDFSAILDQFTKIDAAERNLLLGKSLWK